MKNIKIGGKEYDNVEYISCACAEVEGEQRRFIDEDTPQEELETALNTAV